MNDTVRHPQLAFVFPGQGSQSVGMVSALAEAFPAARQRFEIASEVLGLDLWALVAQGPESELNRTRNTQPALLAASVAAWDAWLASGGPRPTLMAGHSFGEYTALVCAGALDYETGVALAADRGRFMQEAVAEGEGAMAAILGLDRDAVTAACTEATEEEGVCACANLNAPGQIVVAGTRAAVERACTAAAARGAKRAVLLPVSVPAHCELMRPAAASLAARLDDVAIGTPDTPVLHNVDVEPHAEAADIRAALVRQLHSPVRWIETVERFAAEGVGHICECGPSKVLATLIKRIDRSLSCHSLGDPASLAAAARRLAEEIT